MALHTPAIHQPAEPSNVIAFPASLDAPGQELPFLEPTAQQRAIDFILEFGTNLQRERVLYHFPTNGGTPDNSNVLAALGHYQNDDGGFGHGLEADLRTKKSTVIATTVGLQILDSCSGMDSDLANAALQYLVGQYREDGWLAIDAQANDAPHAPWWRFKAADHGFQANPSAEVLKYLLDNRMMATTTPALLDTAIAHLVAEPLDMHELLCYGRLYESTALTKAQRMTMLPLLLSHAFRLVNSEPLDWEEYCLTPLSIATRPDSVFAEFFADLLPLNFQFLIDTQADDGSWLPNWSWAGEFPATWKVVETEIKAELSLKNLMLFRAYGGLTT
jgi:hypothetical protein